MILTQDEKKLRKKTLQKKSTKTKKLYEKDF